MLLLVANTLSAQTTKKINQSYTVGESASVEIDNSFGKVHVTSTDGSKVDIQVEVTTYSRSKEKEKAMLDDIDINFEETPSSLSMSSEIRVKTRGSEKFEVDFTVSVPRKNMLKIRNSFGDVYVDDRDGEVDIDLDYGALKSQALKKGGRLDISFGKGDVEYFQNGDIHVQYCDFFFVSGSSQLELDQEFSNVEVRGVSDLNLRARYGSLEIEKAEHVDANVQYTDFTIDRLGKSLDMTSKYASGFTIGEVSSDFEFIIIDGSYSSYRIDLEEDLSASFSGNFKYCDLRASGVDMDVRERIKDNSHVSYKASIGGGNSSKRIEIRSSYGDLRLTQ